MTDERLDPDQRDVVRAEAVSDYCLNRGPTRDRLVWKILTALTEVRREATTYCGECGQPGECACIENLKAEIERLRGLVQRICDGLGKPEDDMGYCYFCASYTRSEGHEPNCAWLEILQVRSAAPSITTLPQEPRK